MSSLAPDFAGRIVGGYRVARLLGAGAMGKVYLLEHARLPNTFAALKVLSPRRGNAALLRERFVQEAMVAAAIGGDRVARPLDIGSFDDETPYIIMEYVEGRTVADALDAGGPLPLAHALAIAYRVADTIALAHARGIVHRDLKPSNIMLVDEELPRVKVLDFGVARAVGDIKLAQTLESAVIGSPGYMSPEAATGMVVDERTDVFSLAVTLFKMLTGRLPFDGDNAQAMVAAILTQAPRSIADARPAPLDVVPPAIEETLKHALHKSASERPAMAQLRDALYDHLRAAAPDKAHALGSGKTTVVPPLAREVDVLGATVQHTSDSALLRAEVERFAAARVQASTTLRLGRRPWRLIAPAVFVAIGGVAAFLGALHARAPSQSPSPLPSSPSPRHVTPSQRQLTTSGNILGTAMAPDGKTVAYIAGDKVYVRDLDSDATRLLGDGTAARMLAFTPDSNYVLYAVPSDGHDDHHIFRRPRAGGPAEAMPLFDVGVTTIAPDGKTFERHFYPQRTLTLLDGKGKELSTLPVSGTYTWLEATQFSPDGERLLVETEHGDASQLHLVTRDGKQQAELRFEHVDEADWYGHDLLLLRREPLSTVGDLVWQPLDRDRLHAAGEARLVLPRIHGGGFDLSSDGRLAVYVVRSREAADVWTLEVDTGGKPTPRRVDFGTAIVCGTAIAPGGQRVAITTFDGEHAVIGLAGFGQSELRPLARATACVTPAWSPDEKRLAWRDGFDLAITGADGTGTRVLKLSGASGGDSTVTWLDRSRVLYHLEGHRVWNSIDVDSGAIAALTDGNAGWAFGPVVAPDGTRVALEWNRADRGVYTVDARTREERFVAHGMLRLQGWSGDGKALYVAEDINNAPHDGFAIFRQPVDGGKAKPWITLPISSQSRCSFARDGKRGVCGDYQGRTDAGLLENLDQLIAAAK